MSDSEESEDVKRLARAEREQILSVIYCEKQNCKSF